MRKLTTTLLFCVIAILCFAQKQRKSALYLNTQFNATLHDATPGNNPWGAGFGLQLFLRNTSKLKPTIDFTADAYLEDDKVLRLYDDGTPMAEFGGMINLFAGGSYHFAPTAYLSLVAGPCFIGGDTKLGVKPSVGFYFSPRQQVTAKLSYINIFNRDERLKQGFGSLSFSLGVKLF